MLGDTKVVFIKSADGVQDVVKDNQNSEQRSSSFVKP